MSNFDPSLPAAHVAGNISIGASPGVNSILTADDQRFIGDLGNDLDFWEKLTSIDKTSLLRLTTIRKADGTPVLRCTHIPAPGDTNTRNWRLLVTRSAMADCINSTSIGLICRFAFTGFNGWFSNAADGPSDDPILAGMKQDAVTLEDKARAALQDASVKSGNPVTSVEMPMSIGVNTKAAALGDSLLQRWFQGALRHAAFTAIQREGTNRPILDRGKELYTNLDRWKQQALDKVSSDIFAVSTTVTYQPRRDGMGAPVAARVIWNLPVKDILKLLPNLTSIVDGSF